MSLYHAAVKKPKCASGQCQFCEVKLKYIELSSCARCENMDGDHYNDEEIDVQRASDDDMTVELMVVSTHEEKVTLKKM